MECEDVCFEEAEFGMEKPGDVEEETEVQEVTETEGITRIKSENECEAITSETKCICFLSQLKNLARMNISACKTCGAKELELVDSYVGSALYFRWVNLYS